MPDYDKLGTQTNELISDAYSCTIILPVDLNIIDLDAKRVEAEARGLEVKAEFHITIIGSRTGKQIQGRLDELGEVERQERWEEIVEIAKSIDWQVEFLHEYYYIEKEYEIEEPVQGDVSQGAGVELVCETRKSIIRMAKVRGLTDFYARLNDLLRTNLEPQLPTHVTLFTTSTNKEKTQRGIGVNTLAEFRIMKPEKI